MKLDRKTMGKICFLILFTILVIVCFFEWELLLGLISSVFSLLTPFLVGILLAVVINVLMRFLERTIFGTKFAKKRKLLQKIKRPVSILLCFVIITGVLALVCWLLIPQLGTALNSAINNLDTALPRLKTFAHEHLSKYPELLERLDTVLSQKVNWALIVSGVINFLKTGTLDLSAVRDVFSTAQVVMGQIIDVVITAVFAIVFCCYILAQKENLKRQTSRLGQAVFSRTWYRRLEKLYHLCADIFSKFIAGQCLEAVILFAIYSTFLSIGRFPYAVLIAIIIALLSFVPIFGMYAAGAIGTLLVLMVSPWQAVAFLISFIIIQQIEGNLIYPHVVGNSIGLPSIWVLLAVTVGGSLFGIAGMLFFIPGTAVVYHLVREGVRWKLDGVRETPERTDGEAEPVLCSAEKNTGAEQPEDTD